MFQLNALEDRMYHLNLKRTVFSVQILILLNLIPSILTGVERVKACCVVQQIEEKEKNRLKKFY